MGFFTKLVSLAFKVSPGSDGPAQLQAHKNRVVCSCYSVKGKNPETGRRKTVYVVVESTAALDEVQKRSGLLPPFEVEAHDYSDAPTDRQIAYAEKLGFAFPSDASSSDASIFLTRYEDNLPLTPSAAPDDLIRYVIGKGIFVPAYAGALEVSALYLNGVPHSEKAAFFCMRVYCNISRRRYHFLEEASSAERELFSEFAAHHESDGDFLRSLLHYSASDLPLDTCASLKKLKAYDIAADFLRDKGVV